MITGDHQSTAAAIASRLGILRGEGAYRVIDGQELDRLSGAELASRAESADVFARVNPIDKLRIVKALQERGHVVAMTGDGVNDAPGLSAADVGIAMGQTGTEVAKEAADMVLADDNFATIEAAVEEGRAITDNLKKVVNYLVTTTVASLGTVTVAILAGLPLPLLAAQLLWINLVTDGVFDKTLALERKEPDLMERPPRPIKAPFIGRRDLIRVLTFGSLMVAGTLAVYLWDLHRGATLEHARTMAFGTLVFFQWASAFSHRSLDKSVLFELGLASNRYMLWGLVLAMPLQLAAIYAPPLQTLLSTVSLSAVDFGLTILVGGLLFAVTETAKVVHKRLKERGYGA